MNTIIIIFDLFENCLDKIIHDYKLANINKNYYINDRLDNLHIIKEKNKNVIIYHCYNMYKLYKFNII
jgi:hypothetical protein